MDFGFENNREISGFRVIRAEWNEELEGRAVRMEHIRTGAQLFWLDNGEENMVFSITFRTLPEDDTGVFHILEHSVLNGSRKYPVREPFVELLKSSMNTFLNAMTFPDMTMYPVSSRNPRDLMNLTNVYLDAVFHPLSVEDPKPFWQEGWHIDRDEDGLPEYRGVVFNEMKGSMSNVDNLIEHQLARQLFPDTCYGFNSGGDPESIPELTWEKYRECYRKHYHPSNALIYLDGALPIEEMLETIDGYLREYDRREELRPEFRMQQPVASEQTIAYELDPQEEKTNRGYLTLGRITGTWQDAAENMVRGIVGEVLTGSNEAPLKRMALERGLAQDLNLSVDDTGYQSYLTIHAENVTDGKEGEILSLLEETGRKIQAEGLDRDAAEASMNRLIYNLREDEEPRGIGRCIRAMGRWLYGGEPDEALVTQSLIREVRKMIEDGKIDRIAADMLLNREGMAVLHTRPSHTLGEEKRTAEAERLRRITEKWTAEERAANERLMDELEAWQQQPDSERALASLPKLTRADADVTPEWIGTEWKECCGVPVLYHRIPCNGVVHVRVSFSLTDLTLEELTRTALAAGMLGRLPTQKHDAFRLQQEIKRYTGSLGASVSCRVMEGEDETCTPYLVAWFSALEENADRAQELLKEILTETRFRGQEDRILEMVQQNELSARQRIVSAGHLIAIKNVASHFSADGAVRNALDGDVAVRYLHGFARNQEDEMEKLLRCAERMMDTSFCRRRMTLSLTGSEEISLSVLAGAFPEGEAVPDSAAYRSDAPMQIGYRIPAQIGFTARGYRLSRCGLRFSGIVWLASGILSLGYLWNRVRVQGGAYGAGLQTDRNGNIISYSYRDPTPAKTLGADAGAAAYLREFVRNGENLDSFIISSLNELNPLLSPRDKGALADAQAMIGYTKERAEEIRQEILHATGEELEAYGKWLDQFAREGAVCVVAHQEALDTCEGLQVREL